LTFLEALKHRPLVLLLLCLTTGVSFAQKQDSITFRLHLKKGDTYSVASSGAYKTLTVVEDTIAVSNSQTFTSEYLMLVEDVRNDGNTMISMKLENFVVNSQKAYFDFRDSTKSFGKEGAKNDSNKKIIGLTFMLLLNERSEVLRSNLDTIMTAEKSIDKIIPKISNEIFNGVVFPNHSVKVGETWQASGNVNKIENGEKGSGNYEYTLDAVHGRNAEISSISHNSGAVSKSIWSSSSTDRYIVDIPSGWSNSGTHKIKIEAKAKLGYEFAPMTMDSDITVKITKL
jgi:hypothetical protein